ncbi:ras-related protein Rab-37 isoform X1 [Callorhinus ursinus]|uniref:small monomeric GTPase n=1 Tax=Callorhinus ursinus TaxID=34884 RepID=A0A3Q7N745_CALUR|nr:ras-related protein Rab-37 isoform X1 [Callorhinus ursinus]
MTGMSGAAATRDGEAPEHSPPCSPSYDVTGKVMLLGDSGVGKTCFLIQFKDGAFLSGTFIATVGIDFRNKVVTVDGVRVKLQIWDTAGQERFRSVTHAYYRDAQALLLLYDITNKSSFDNIRAWLTEIHEYAQRDVVIMLLGNKADVSSERVIRSEDGEILAREYGVPFMETSAKTGMNVELAFLAIAKSETLWSPRRNSPAAAPSYEAQGAERRLQRPLRMQPSPPDLVYSERMEVGGPRAEPLPKRELYSHPSPRSCSFPASWGRDLRSQGSLLALTSVVFSSSAPEGSDALLQWEGRRRPPQATLTSAGEGKQTPALLPPAPREQTSPVRWALVLRARPRLREVTKLYG